MKKLFYLPLVTSFLLGSLSCDNNEKSLTKSFLLSHFVESPKLMAQGEWKEKNPNSFVLFTVKDLNGDGLLDLLYKDQIKSGNCVSYKINLGNKFYSGGKELLLRDKSDLEFDFIVGDFCGESLEDIVTMRKGELSKGIELFQNKGNGVFDYSGLIFENKNHKDIRALTLRGNSRGTNDILIAVKTGNTYEIRVLENLGVSLKK